MDADELYGLALDQFVPERSALTKALRADGRRDEAADVAKLRKPSVAGWAVNQLVRTQGRGMKELFDAGDTLRGAQADLLAGRGDGRALRSANEGERAAVESLVETARGLLTSDGHELSPAIIERVADTLHAAALDETAREQVREGRLERELRHVGMGLGEGAAAATAPAPPTSRAKPQKRAPTNEPEKPAQEQAKRAETAHADAKRAEAERAEARKSARVAEAKARRRLERAASALRAAEERRERASEALAAADGALAAARAEVDEATKAHERAQQATGA